MLSPLKILLYNSGIDKIPRNKKDLDVELSELSFVELTTLPNKATIVNPCGKEPYIDSYNKINVQHVKNIIKQEKIDLCMYHARSVCETVTHIRIY